MLKMFTVYDSKAEAYLPPFYSKSKGEALRSFTDAVNDPQSQLNKHPEDYTLFEVGDFDENLGGFIILEAKTALGTAIDFKN